MRTGSLFPLLATGAVAVWVGWAATTAPCQPAEVPIVVDGKSTYCIVVPDDADQARTAQASALLQGMIARATGVTLQVTKESALAKGTSAFYLGKSQAARRAGLPVDELNGWAYLIQVVGNDIFLAGEDAEDNVKARYPVEHLGTLKAVVAFLEEQVGVRFLMPGEFGVYVPELERLTVPADLKSSWKPVFDYVTGGSPRDPLINVAYNMPRGNSVLYSYGGHSYYDAVPEQTYGKTHPEYFALVGGKRTPAGNHLCISNADVQELMLKEMEKHLDEGFQWVELAQTDGYVACQCDACNAIHADPSERTWIVHRKLAEQMLKRRPGKKVMIISYGPTVHPPKTFTSFPENVVIQMCRYTPEAFEEWASFRVAKSVYVYNWGNYHIPGFAPIHTPRYMVEQARLFRQNGVRGIYICGLMQTFGLDGPSYYAYGKAVGNPDRDPDDLRREYVAAAFEEASVPMLAFFAAMHNRIEWYSAFKAPELLSPNVPGPFSTPEDYYCHFFPAKLLKDLSDNLERAKALARSDRVKAQLQLVEIEFNNVRNLASIFQYYRAYRLAPNWPALDLLAGAVEARGSMVDALFPQGKLMQIPGMPVLFGAMPKEFVFKGGRHIDTPLNWDFALLREKQILPGVGSRRVEASRVTGITLDGKLDDAAWQQLEFQELSEIGMGALRNGSRFKVGYDDGSIYLGVECDFDNVARMDELKPVGAGGQAYYQESIEIMLDPYGDRERYCHLIFNPVPNSTYQRRLGYITDPLHPLYGKPDPLWEGEWDYAAFIDRERKCWTAEVRIPFTSLEASPPVPGTIWTLNVGRNEFPTGDKSVVVYSLWSPNLEMRSFHNTATFGDVVFK